MGKKFDTRPYAINDFKEWDERGELVLSPKFQRRSVWSDKARSFLIDTVVRGLPIPKIFMRHSIDHQTGKSVREVVDGQQRLRTILNYLKGAFPLQKNHNKEYGGCYFQQLPDDVRSDILRYEISSDLILDSKDAIVLDIFARLNTYTVTLNKQELLNAKYFGTFKQTVYSLGFEFVKFWVKNRIITERQIFRMAEAEFTSELVAAMLEGMQNKTSLESFYKKYDDNFVNNETIKRRFREIMDQIGTLFGESLQESTFNSKPLFYTLFCILYHFKYGLKNEEKVRRVSLTKQNLLKIKDGLDQVEVILNALFMSRGQEIYGL